MTQNNIDAEREVWSQYLDALHVKRAPMFGYPLPDEAPENPSEP